MSSSMNDAELYQLILATTAPKLNFPLTSVDLKIPFALPAFEDMLAVMWEHPATKEFWFAMEKQIADGTVDERGLMIGFFELILKLGSKVVNKVISLATPWPLDARVCEAIGRWSNRDRMASLMMVRNGEDWTGFFALFLSSTPPKSEDSPEPQVTVADLTAAVEMADRQESGSKQPVSSLPTTSASPSIPDAQLQLAAPSPSAGDSAESPELRAA
ncbi:MAG: hypothetical protein JWO56_2847 [Acidobacteria bacterium]|nr:hypothetical protein [Acidobacteriota bacterium]